MCGYNWYFIIEKGPFVEWMAATGDELTQYLENRDDRKCLFQRKTAPLKILDHCKWPPEIMTEMKLQYALHK